MQCWLEDSHGSVFSASMTTPDTTPHLRVIWIISLLPRAKPVVGLRSTAPNPFTEKLWLHSTRVSGEDSSVPAVDEELEFPVNLQRGDGVQVARLSLGSEVPGA